MFGKLLKYELKSTYKVFLGAFAAYVVIITASWPTLRSGREDISLTLMLLGITALFVMTFVLLFQRYNANLYGGEGYLMFTAPVGSKTLLLSKLVSALIWVAALMLICVYTVIYMTVVVAPGIHGIFSFTVENAGTIASMIVSVALTVLVCIITIYFSITVSKLAVWRRFGTLMGFVTFFAVNWASALPYNLFCRFGYNRTYVMRGMIDMFVITRKADSANLEIYLVQNITDIVVAAALFFATAKIMEKHTSLR